MVEVFFDEQCFKNVKLLTTFFYFSEDVFTTLHHFNRKHSSWKWIFFACVTSLVGQRPARMAIFMTPGRGHAANGSSCGCTWSCEVLCLRAFILRQARLLCADICRGCPHFRIGLYLLFAGKFEKMRKTIKPEIIYPLYGQNNGRSAQKTPMMNDAGRNVERNFGNDHEITSCGQSRRLPKLRSATRGDWLGQVVPPGVGGVLLQG